MKLNKQEQRDIDAVQDGATIPESRAFPLKRKGLILPHRKGGHRLTDLGREHRTPRDTFDSDSLKEFFGIDG